jgi:alcohol dehydrogenase (cytochrome c)
MEGVVAKPSARGGANWPPSSYDPDTNTYYVCARDALAYSRAARTTRNSPNPAKDIWEALWVECPFPRLEFWPCWT